jgi:hypothetical protein
MESSGIFEKGGDAFRRVDDLACCESSTKKED